MMMNLYKTGSYGLLMVALTAAACGEDGEPGTAGPMGAQGPQGEQGVQGVPGMNGADGTNGTNGTNGTDGANGTNGTNGTNGLNSLVVQTQIGPGTNCPNGGVRIDSGIDDNGDGMLAMDEVDESNFVCNGGQPFTLQLLHFADVDGNESIALDAMDEFSALVDGFRNDPVFGPATILVSSGDNVIPGPRWFAAEDDAVELIVGGDEPGGFDHYIMNQLGVAASALGNHELDQGPGEFADAIGSDGSFGGAIFPYVAANVDFSGERDLRIGTDGEDSRLLGGQVAGSTKVRIGNEVVGFVGVSTPDLATITAAGNLVVSGSTTMIADLAGAIQPAIDALAMDGVNKIVVLAHLQNLDLEKALALQLRNVDIIVGGGSSTRMGDANDRLFGSDASFTENYPFQTMDADMNPLLIVNVDGDYKYLGRLVVSFDDNGVIIPTSLNDEVSGAWASVPENVLLSGGTPNTEVVTARDAVQTVITAQFENVIGHTDVFLEGRRGLVRSEETNLGNLGADSIKWYAEGCPDLSTTTVLTLRNGGGIRAEIGNAVTTGTVTALFPPFNDGLNVEAGDVSEGHLRGTFRFNNGIVILTLTGTELKTILEHGVREVAPGVLPGDFPQVAGISFSWDPTGTPQVSTSTSVTTPGDRIKDIWVDGNRDGVPEINLYAGGVAQPAASATYTIATLNFLANGGDDYPYPVLAANRRQLYSSLGFNDPDANMDGIPDTPIIQNCDPGLESTISASGAEQDALAEYFQRFHPNPTMAFNTPETPAAQDRRIQNLSIIPTFITP